MTSNSTEGAQDCVANIERMVILPALEEYGAATKDANQRRAVFNLKDRLNAARRIILEPAALSAPAGEGYEK